jgi:aminomethyltransferase
MPLSKIHSRLLPKMGKFAGYDLPLRFSKFNIRDVVVNTRKPGFTTVFDVSHMGVYETNINDNIFDYNLIKYNLNKLLNIDLNNLNSNKAKLTVILDENGTVIDDLIISNIEDRKYRLVVNSEKKTENFFTNFDPDTLIRKSKSIIALQGDGSQTILENIVKTNLNDLYFMENKSLVKDKLEICRCGYTGEDGFELYLNDAYAEEIYENLVSLGENSEFTKVQFGGLIERDVLRTEAGLNLSGDEFSENMNIKFNALKMPFLIDKKIRDDSNKALIFESNLVQTLLYSEKPIQRGSILIDNIENLEEEIGFITSTVKSFNLNKFIAIGYLDKDYKPNKNQKKIFIKDRKHRRNYLEIQKKFIDTNYYRKS